MPKDFKEKAQMYDLSGIISMIVIIGVGIFILILMSVISTKAYRNAESDINGITDATIKDHVQTGIADMFGSYGVIGEYTVYLVMAVIAGAIIVVLLSSLGFFMNRGGGGGGPL